MKNRLAEKIDRILPADRVATHLAKARQASLAKPPERLGKLEDISIRLAGIYGKDISGSPDPGCVLVFCADNGVAAQGISSAPQSVTRAQTVNFTRRLTGVGALAKSFGSELLIVDVGVKDPIPRKLYVREPFSDTYRIVDRRVRPGTGETDDISKGNAMTEDEALDAMLTGIEMAEAAMASGYGIIGIGEMGIGNTTTSAAVLSALTGAGSDVTCGRGGGINDQSFEKKKEIVDACSESWRSDGGLLGRYPLLKTGIKTGANGGSDDRETDAADDGVTDVADDKAELIERLEAVTRLLTGCGGFDICAMAGAFLGAAANRLPVVIDGYISVVAALVAATIKPETADCMFASHKSAEPGYELAVETLGLKPFLDLDMRLGEGSGCPIAFAVIKGAWDVFMNMGTFEEAEIDDDYLEEVREGGCF